MLVPVILAGGTGSRLWPLSRTMYPKQLLPLVSGQTMLQDTIMRLESYANIAAPLVICNQEHRFLVTEQLKQIGVDDAHIILEPIGRNTAPAAAIAAFFLMEFYQQDPVMIILPADHVLDSSDSFMAVVAQAEANAKNGKLVTFGVKPTHPETGYGYIKTEDQINDQAAYPVLQFVEKPDYTKAQSYLASGRYYWNSGMFVFQASRFLAELEQYSPDIYHSCKKALCGITKDLNFSRLDKTIFANCPANSIDYAVMEKTHNAVLVPLNTAWSDVGSWSSLCEVQHADAHHNVIQGDVIAFDTDHSYIRSESRMIATLGVSNHIIVETPDAVLVAHKDKCQSVKEIVDFLKKKKRIEIDLHRRVYRPWGHYETVDQGHDFQVKRITVKPGASLSLQMHHHRSEHWVVVSGTAEVTRGDNIFILSANESTYIPIGVKHRLSNPGKINLEIIEVQSGRYLSEDDIVRYEDVYGRTAEPA